jgi:PAS domain S-box-containing protein
MANFIDPFSSKFLLKWRLSQYLPFLLFVIWLALSILGWNGLRQENSRNRNDKFELIVGDVLSRIEMRLRQHEQILLGGAGLFDAQESVNREAWNAYVTRLRLNENYPGILGVGFSQLITPQELPAHISHIRSQGFPNYSVQPQGERSIYTSIVFLEPFAGRNLAAFGFDMSSEATRAKAMWRAAESGATSITGRVKLVQENKGKPQAGFLMYVPIYKKNMPMSDAAERRKALLGFAYSPYRVEDLMVGILGAEVNSIDLKIYDGDQINVENQMFESQTSEHTQTADNVYSKKALLNAQYQILKYGQTWTITIQTRPEFDEKNQSFLPNIVLGMSIGIGFLLSCLLWVSIRQGNRANKLALKMTEDIRHTASALKESEKRFDLAVRGTNDGIWDWNLETNEVYFSPRLYELLGLPPKTFVPKINQIWDLIHPDDQDANQAAILAHLREGVTYNVDYRLKTIQNGQLEWRWFNVRAGTVRSAEGRAVRMAGAATDITERRRNEQLKSEFVSTVSHELRTPLTSIHGAMGLIRGGALGPLSDSIQRLLDISLKNSTRLIHLINDLLDMEKLVAGKMQFQIQTWEIHQIVQQAIENNRAYADQYHVSFEMIREDKNIFVSVDHERLEQVLTNLLSNAAKFSPKGDVIIIKIDHTKGRVRVSVRDHGNGIPEEFLPRLFQKFSQADSSDSREKGGTGLGLAICKELMERMGGVIGCESEVGKGSCFYFEMQALAITKSSLAQNIQ